jgi:hypothetical protein
MRWGAMSDVWRSTTNFSLVLGGPLYQLWLRIRLARPPLRLLRRRIAAFVAITVLPLAALSALTGHLLGGPVPFLLDLTNLQFITTLPLLVGAEVFVHRRLRPLVPEFERRGLVTPEDRARFQRIVARALRLRNSVLAELLLLLIACTGGFWLWRMYASLHVATWYLVPADSSTKLTLAGYWLAFVSLPIERFLLLRWYFRLAVWYLFLWRVSRLRLRLNALHGDRAGGLGFLELSASSFAPVLLAQTTYLALVVGNQIWHQGARLTEFRLEIAVFLVMLLLFVLAPLTFFVMQMEEARRYGARRYGRFASRYTNAFDTKWLAGRSSPTESVLGTGDIQSLADAANAYDVVREMRLVPFSKRMVFHLAILVALPLLPLAFTLVPMGDLLRAIVTMFL